MNGGLPATNYLPRALRELTLNPSSGCPGYREWAYDAECLAQVAAGEYQRARFGVLSGAGGPAVVVAAAGADPRPPTCGLAWSTTGCGLRRDPGLPGLENEGEITCAAAGLVFGGARGLGFESSWLYPGHGIDSNSEPVIGASVRGGFAAEPGQRFASGCTA